MVLSSPENLERGLSFENWLLKNVFPRHQKNKGKYDIDLVKPGYPAIEVKFEGSPFAPRKPNGQLENLCVQLTEMKYHGPLKVAGPWKAYNECRDALYVVGEKCKVNGYSFVMITTAIELKHACRDYLPGGPKHLPENL